MTTNRRQAIQMMSALGGALALPFGRTALAQTDNKLTWRHFPAGPTGFFRSPVLLTNANEAVLIDGGWTLSDGRALAEAIRATGKPLTTIYISQSDPDYYFSLGPVRAAFPNARVVAAPAALDEIRANVQTKLNTWGPQLRDNGPQTLSDVVLPQALDARTLNLGSEVIEIVDSEGFRKRGRYLWVPSLRAVFGGVLTFNRVHVWTADTPTPEERAAWIAALDRLAARNPAIVVAGHAAADAPADASAIAFTKNYLLAFDEERVKAADSTALIAAMNARYPNLGMGVALEIGAKVAKGEMRWG